MADQETPRPFPHAAAEALAKAQWWSRSRNGVNLVRAVSEIAVT